MLSYIITVIINEDPYKLEKEFILLVREMKNCKNSDIILDVAQMLNKFLEFNTGVYKVFFTKNHEIFDYLLDSIINILESEQKEEIINEKILGFNINSIKIMLKNSHENLSKFWKKMNLFNLIIENLDIFEGKISNLLVFVFLEEEPNVIEHYLEFLLEKITDNNWDIIDDFEKIYQIFKLCFKLFSKKSKNLLKRCQIFEVFIDVFRKINENNTNVWNLEKQCIVLEFFDLLQKSIENPYFEKFFIKQKNIFKKIIQEIKKFNLMKSSFASEIINGLFKMSMEAKVTIFIHLINFFINHLIDFSH